MQQLAKGQRLRLQEIVPDAFRFRVGLAAPGLPVDFACFGLSAAGVLVDERYMTFFNQPRTPCGGVELGSVGANGEGFRLNLALLPGFIERVVVVASTGGAYTMSSLGAGHLSLLDSQSEAPLACFSFGGSDFSSEKALMLGEFYRKDGDWRFMAVGQGFQGGLDAIVRHFGASVEVAAPAPSVAKVSLEKRVEREAPKLVNLVKQAGVSLGKAGLGGHHARVCLCLDISGSMRSLYRKGLVQAFAERILALGCQFDDDGGIDVFLFGSEVHQPPVMDLSNWAGYVQRVIDQHPLEGDTRYGLAMQAIRQFYFPDATDTARAKPLKSALPVYVMFVTDGSTSDKALTQKQLRCSSMEPIFWQFMGIGKGRKSTSKLLAAFGGSDFPFLESLDELPGSLIDNANFFSVLSPDEYPDAALYDLLMAEYPGWLQLAGAHGML